jgi:hypothetical protein
MIERSGSIPLTSGSGSGRPKNMWIRIRNTGEDFRKNEKTHSKFGQISEFLPNMTTTTFFAQKGIGILMLGTRKNS